ncbi:MAG: hypothetical protein JRJ03_08125 [Deltaproteobacteria bacterium]|nr:hypothetical protein [Deltaproteobacteria bacterium]
MYVINQPRCLRCPLGAGGNGGKVRDTEDEFKGADLRDEETKFCFAYDYQNKLHFRVRGTTFKPALYRICKKLGGRAKL